MDGECWCKLFGIPGDDVLIHQTKLCGMSLSQVALMRDEYEAHDTLKMAEDLARWKASCSMLQARLDSRDEFLAKMPKREMMRSLALKNALKNKVGQKVLARIGQGTAKPGKSAPWILIDATGNPADLAKANAYIGNAGAKPAATPAPAETKQVIDANQITPEVAALLAQLGAKPV